jgi:ribosome maturation factor RimP
LWISAATRSKSDFTSSQYHAHNLRVLVFSKTQIFVWITLSLQEKKALMNSTQLLHPSQLTPESHDSVLLALQSAAVSFNQQKSPIRPLHVRDFWFVIEDGQAWLDLFVEPLPAHTGPTPFPAPELAVSLDECLPLHHYLLESGALDGFDDNVGVRVGSLGIEPPLRTLAHFEAAKGHFVTLKTWTKRQGRDRFTSLLDDVKADVSTPSLLLREGTEVIEVPLSAVKFAQALLEKPKAAKANPPRKSKRGS